MREAFEKIIHEYLIEKEKPTKGNKLYNYLCNSKCDITVYNTGVIDKNVYLVKSSNGQSKWPEVPWIAVFDKDISITATEGYYIVYLFSCDMKRVYLSLNQGWTFYQNTYGRKTGRLIIRKITEMWRQILRSSLQEFVCEDIDLGYKGKTTFLPKGYELGHICGKCYDTSKLPAEKDLIKDLQNMISVFRELKGNMIGNSIEDTNNYLLSEYEVESPRKEKNDTDKQFNYINKIIANYGVKTSLELKSDMPDIITEFQKQKKSKNAPKIDYVIKTEKQGKVGLAGELMVIEYEKRKLEMLKIDKKVEHISKLTNDAEGYDIKSYDENGKEIHIEVKTTKSDINTPFYLSINELLHCKNNVDKYRLYRVYNFKPENNTGELYIVEGDVGKVINLEPYTFVSRGRKKDD